MSFRGHSLGIAAFGLAVTLSLIGSATRAAADPQNPDSEDAKPPARAEPMNQSDNHRQSVRGCAGEGPCEILLHDLHEFEMREFGSAPTGPWTNPLTKPVRRPTSPTPPLGTKPSQIRPELAWMDNLFMPDIPVRWDERLIKYLLHYKDNASGRALMRAWLTAQGRYAPMIVDKLRRARMPEDLLYVSMIESSYNPNGGSYAGAAGLWQFMPGGGRIYGLVIDRWVDERRDPIRSTEAAIDYFYDLHQRFGDWHLAMVSYNAGYGAVLQSIARFNTNDLWSILSIENGLAYETQLYVPKALAAAIIGKNREAFGFGDVVPLPPEQWDDITPAPSTALTTVAKVTGCSLGDIKQLNPHIRQGRTPPGRPKFVLRVPKGCGAKYSSSGPAFDESRYQLYQVKQGERLEDVATAFGVSPFTLRGLNDISHESEIAGGVALVVPRVDPAVETANRQQAKDDLHSSGLDSKPGDPLIVAVPDKDFVISGKHAVYYRACAGDSLDLIAAPLGVTPKELAEWNGLEPEAKIHPKMILQAWVDAGFDAKTAAIQLLDPSLIVVTTRGSAEHLELAEQRRGRERIIHTATKRETYADVGKKYGLGKYDVSRINSKPENTVLQPGDTAIVYKVVDSTRSDRAKKQLAASRGVAPKKAKAKGKGKGKSSKSSSVAKKTGGKADSKKTEKKKDTKSSSGKKETKKSK